MTERERSTRGPTNKDIHEALQNLAVAFHDGMQALQARDDEYRLSREAEQRDRRYVRERLDQLFGQLDTFQRKVERQLEVRDQEFDALEAKVDALTADVEALKAGRP